MDFLRQILFYNPLFHREIYGDYWPEGKDYFLSQVKDVNGKLKVTLLKQNVLITIAVNLSHSFSTW